MARKKNVRRKVTAKNANESGTSLPDILRQRAFDLTAVPVGDLLALATTEAVDELLGKGIIWRVITGQDELLDWGVERYNHVVTSDMHERCLNIPKERHPLYRYFATHAGRRSYAAQVGYIHNQIAVEGVLNDVPCTILHLGSVHLRSLHIGFVELANPNVRDRKPLPGQEFSGLGHGIFKEIIDRLKSFAMKCGFERITGYAVDKFRADIFCRRGFALDRGSTMFSASIRTGIQIPIVLELLS